MDRAALLNLAAIQLFRVFKAREFVQIVDTIWQFAKSGFIEIDDGCDVEHHRLSPLVSDGWVVGRRPASRNRQCCNFNGRCKFVDEDIKTREIELHVSERIINISESPTCNRQQRDSSDHKTLYWFGESHPKLGIPTCPILLLRESTPVLDETDYTY